MQDAKLNAGLTVDNENFVEHIFNSLSRVTPYDDFHTATYELGPGDGPRIQYIKSVYTAVGLRWVNELNGSVTFGISRTDLVRMNQYHNSRVKMLPPDLYSGDEYDATPIKSEIPPPYFPALVKGGYRPSKPMDRTVRFIHISMLVYWSGEGSNVLALPFAPGSDIHSFPAFESSVPLVDGISKLQDIRWSHGIRFRPDFFFPVKHFTTTRFTPFVELRYVISYAVVIGVAERHAESRLHWVDYRFVTCSEFDREVSSRFANFLESLEPKRQL